MNLNHLRAFVTVAECLSFSRAAERLHVSQPALSHQIRSLEDDVGARLFVRNQRTVSLSIVGREVLEDAERILTNVDEFQARIAKVSSGARGRLRIGFVASATTQIVPKLTIAFRKSFPEATIELKNIPTVRQIESLRQRTLDIGIVRLPLDEADIEVLPLFSEPFAIVLSKQHALRSKPDLTVRELRDVDFVAYAERQAPGFFRHWTGLCRKAGFSPRIVQEVAEMETALALVAANVGAAIVPEGVAKRYARSVMVRSLRSEKLRSELGLAFLKLNTSPLARRLVALTEDAGLLEHHPRRQKSGNA